MTEQILLARVEGSGGGVLRILAPRVGWWLDQPAPGTVVGPGSRVGTIAHLNGRVALVLPEGAIGSVLGPRPRERALAVEYGALLFELAPIAAAGGSPGDGEEVAAARDAREGVGGRHHVVISPTDGVFYRAPSPGSPPFVEPGARLREGQPIGLIEVMKTFNQILYGGSGLPPEADVLEIRAADEAEVRAGDVLVVVRG